MKIHPKSAWSKDKIFQYLDQTETPIRLSCLGADGYPMIASLWFVHKEGVLWAASHENSHIVKVLKNNPKVGFEVATNQYPYHGVRGKADVLLMDDRSENILDKVIDKYLQGGNKSLAAWLLSRKENECAIKISPVALSSWDFSGRMERP